MTRVNFVKLDQRDKAYKICRLTEHYYMQGKRLLLVVQDENQAVALDRFLWTWEREAFLPHAFDNGSVDCLEEPIVIASAEKNPNGADVLIMGKPCSIDFLHGFECVVDFAEAYDDDLLQQSRERFSHYRQQGFQPAMLELDNIDS